MAKTKSPINSTKHYVQETVFTVSAASLNSRTIAEAVSAPDANLATEVREGANISAVYVEMWLSGNTSGQGTTIITLEKVNGNAPDMTYAQSVALYTYPNKKNIIHSSQGLFGGTGNNAVPFIRQWFLIPKGKQRMGLGDKIVLNVSNITGGMNGCGLYTYKEYF